MDDLEKPREAGFEIVVGDKTDDAFDETLLAFNFPLKNQILIAFWGYAGQVCIPSKSGPNCIIPKGVLGVIMFGQRHYASVT